MPKPNLRLMYETAVAALAVTANEKLQAGMGEEEVARWVVQERDLLKQQFRARTPAPVLERIVAQTLERYGNTMGPSADELRASGKSWQEIIDSATRAGRHGEDFFQPLRGT